MTTAEVRRRLLPLAEEKNAAFVAKLIPNVPPERILGVRTPALRKLARELGAAGEMGEFLEDLPHFYLEENALHAFLLEQIRDMESCLTMTEQFLPYIDNWATCDSFSPRVFARHRAQLLERIRSWLASERPYTVRFAVKMLMEHFLGEDFRPCYADWVVQIHSPEYYVNMMRAWYFATALAKQYEAVLPVLEEGRLDAWTHNKAIQKARESYRVSEEHKDRLKALRR